MRQPKPFFRQFTQSWYVQLGNRQINLGDDEEQAFERYYEIMANRGRAKSKYVFVSELLDEYLTWIQKNRSGGTYDKGVHYLSLFVEHVGKQFKIEAMEPFLVLQWTESKPWTATTANDAISIVQRAFNWAVKRGHIQSSPIVIVEGKPTRRRRETVFAPKQWKKLRGCVNDQQFGDLLDFMWATGCRPKEARTVQADHVDLDNRMIVFPPSEAKGERHERVIFMPDVVLNICSRLIEKHPQGPIFRNTRGGPWTSDSVNCRFQRLKKKLKHPCCAYAIRHSFATEGLKQGIDSLTLAQIMGHSDTTMLARHYAHLARNPDYLRQQACRIRT